MRVLVTGAGGFVGRAVCRHLLAAGHQVVGAVRGRAAPAGVEPVAVGGISGQTDWSNALSGVEMVVHLAARVHVMQDSAADPLAEFRAVNRDGTRRLAEAARTAGVRHLLFLSSIKVNGEETRSGQAFTETDPPAPQDPYGVSKWEAEQALAASGLPVTILRPPLVYGPGVAGNLARLLGAIRRGLPLPFGLVRNRRDLVAVDNLASAVLAALQAPPADGQYRTYLVADGQPLSTADLIRGLAAGLGLRPRLLPVPPGVMLAAAALLGKQAAARRVLGNLEVDASLIRAELGWRPVVAPAEALAQVARTAHD